MPERKHFFCRRCSLKGQGADPDSLIWWKTFEGGIWYPSTICKMASRWSRYTSPNLDLEEPYRNLCRRADMIFFNKFCHHSFERKILHFKFATKLCKCQCVTKPKIWTNPKLFPIPFLFDTDTFFGTKSFSKLIPILFPMPKILETDTDTMKKYGKFSNPNLKLFRSKFVDWIMSLL